MLNQARDYKKNLARQTDLNWDGDFDLEEENQTLAELEKKKYLYTPNILSGHLCEQLSYHLFKLKEENKLKKDPQCPLSYAAYGDKQFDDVLLYLSKKLSVLIGKEVLPTYSYARLYTEGEILSKHKDRPSCEISVTVTLDYDKAVPVWPIKMGTNDNIFIEKGDGVLYKGCQIEHWREPYKGKWQTQAFFHFVDASGEFKEYVFDKRKKLGTKAVSNN